MKCKKCGKELGQKNICPVCGPSAVSELPIPEIVKDAFSDEDLKKITLFLIRHRNTWNVDFDSFYDEFPSAPDYKELFSFCQKCLEIILAIEDILSGTDTLSAERIIKVMDEITQRYPGITNPQARLMAKAVFASKDTSGGTAGGAETDPPAESVTEPCWYCKDGLPFVVKECPVCHGTGASAVPQWLKAVRNNEMAIEGKLFCVAEELLKVVNDVIANCDDLLSTEREKTIKLFQKIYNLDFYKPNLEYFMCDLNKALDINFGFFGWHVADYNSPCAILKIIAGKYLPETMREGEFKTRYIELLREKFE